jgi:hypothetical protein
MKKAQKENATFKRSCERKKAIFKKILHEHHKVVIKEHIRVFLFGLACKKKCFVRSRRRRISTFGAFSYRAKWAKSRPSLVNNMSNSKTFIFVLSKQERTELAEKPSHATVPSKKYFFVFVLILIAWKKYTCVSQYSHPSGIS